MKGCVDASVCLALKIFHLRPVEMESKIYLNVQTLDFFGDF